MELIFVHKEEEEAEEEQEDDEEEIYGRFWRIKV